MNMMSCDWQ